MHPLRRMPHTVQTRRIEIGGADVESRAGFPPQTNAAGMPIKIRKKQPSGKEIRRSAVLIAPSANGGNTGVVQAYAGRFAICYRNNDRIVLLQYCYSSTILHQQLPRKIDEIFQDSH